MELPIQRVKALKFTVISKADAYAQSKTNVQHVPKGNQIPQQNLNGTINDSHLGTMSKSSRCSTCNHTKNNCQGHNGILDVKYPFVLPQFEQYVINALKKICINTNDSGQMCLSIVKDSASKCPYCNRETYKPVQVKAINSYRITFTRVSGKGEGKTRDEKVLTIADIERIFSCVSLEAAKREFGCEKGLQDLISNTLVIPSHINRPERRVNSKGQDEMTASLTSIVMNGINIRNCTSSDASDFDKLYSAFVKSMKNYQIGDKNEDADQKAKSLTSSICGKDGSLRSGILGKRVNKIGRGVAACDASNTPDEATLPQEFVKTITMKETLRDYNADRLMKAFNIGRGILGGSHAVSKPDGTIHILEDISDHSRRPSEKTITFNYGDALHRYLQAGDRVIICRQPSLLQNSLGSHRIKIAQDETKDTIDINTLAVSQYHADFNVQAQ